MQQLLSPVKLSFAWLTRGYNYATLDRAPRRRHATLEWPLLYQRTAHKRPIGNRSCKICRRAHAQKARYSGTAPSSSKICPQVEGMPLPANFIRRWWVVACASCASEMRSRVSGRGRLTWAWRASVFAQWQPTSKTIRRAQEVLF